MQREAAPTRRRGGVLVDGGVGDVPACHDTSLEVTRRGGASGSLRAILANRASAVNVPSNRWGIKA